MSGQRSSELMRRPILSNCGLGLGLTVASCLQDASRSGNGNGGNGNGNGDGEPSVVETETIHLGAQSGAPLWYRADEETTGWLRLFDSQEALTEGYLPVPDDRREDVSEFVDETDFETSVLVNVESVGPNGCFTEVSVSGLGVDDGTLVGTASATDTSDDDEMCTEAIVYPSVLVRVTFDGSPPDNARFAITDGWDNEREASAPHEGPMIDPEDLEGFVRPDGDPPVVPEALECGDSNFERHGQGVAENRVSTGETPEDDPVFALRVDERSYERGDTARIRLTNIRDSERGTGNQNKYNLQLRTEEGWQDVHRSIEGDLGYTDEALIHPPGGKFEWSLELTEEGVANGHVHEDRLQVCPELQPGRYRFLFWEPPVAVEFDVVEG